MAATINVPLSFRQQTPALQATYVKSLSDAIKSAQAVVTWMAGFSSCWPRRKREHGGNVWETQIISNSCLHLIHLLFLPFTIWALN